MVRYRENFAVQGAMSAREANAGTFVIGHRELTAGVVCKCTKFPGGHGYCTSQETLFAGTVAQPHPPPMRGASANGRITNDDTSQLVGAVQERSQLWLFGAPLQW